MTPMYQVDYTQIQNYQKALQLIRESVKSEKEDEMFYDYLINAAPSDKDKKIIEGIRNDERKHFKMFRQMYYEMTGTQLPPPEDVKFEKPKYYISGIEKALFGELKAVERYRQIAFGLIGRKYLNMITEILTDELKHASMYNFLYAENKRS